MTGILIGALPGLVAAAAVLLLAWGLRQARHDPLDDVDAEELIDVAALAGPPESIARRPLTARLGQRLVPLLRQALPASVLRRLQRQIDLAGRPPGVDVDLVLAQQAGLLLIGIPVGLLYLRSGLALMVLVLVAFVVIWPLVRLVTLARKRRELIDRDLPDFLDVLAVTVSAGVGFRSALTTVSARFAGPLGAEVTTSLHQIANGASVRSAFKDLRHRTGAESVDEFVTAYLQAEELGAPLAESLNQIAADQRRAATQRALQKASAVAPRISLVSTVVMVPATLILVVLGLFLGSGADLVGVLRGR